jgi:hypothetical protein
MVRPGAKAPAFFYEDSQVIWPSLPPQLPTYPYISAYQEVIYPAGTGGVWRG